MYVCMYVNTHTYIILVYIYGGGAGLVGGQVVKQYGMMDQSCNYAVRLYDMYIHICIYAGGETVWDDGPELQLCCPPLWPLSPPKTARRSC